MSTWNLTFKPQKTSQVYHHLGPPEPAVPVPLGMPQTADKNQLHSVLLRRTLGMKPVKSHVLRVRLSPTEGTPDTMRNSGIIHKCCHDVQARVHICSQTGPQFPAQNILFLPIHPPSKASLSPTDPGAPSTTAVQSGASFLSASRTLLQTHLLDHTVDLTVLVLVPRPYSLVDSIMSF